MKRTTLIGLIIALTLLVGCGEIKQQTFVRDSITGDVNVFPICADKVICYETSSEAHGSGGSCFRDEDLVLKYCGV